MRSYFRNKPILFSFSFIVLCGSGQFSERKLSKLKKSSNFLDQLIARREHCIENLLVGNINLEDCTNAANQHLEEEFETNRRRDILRYIQPEQPNNLGESVALINHDQLEQQRDQDTAAEEDISNSL